MGRGRLILALALAAGIGAGCAGEGVLPAKPVPAASLAPAPTTASAPPATLVNLGTGAREPTPTHTTPDATAIATPTSTTYTVQEGDTLWSIAQQFGLSLELLAAANPTLNPNWLFPGDVVLIPSPDSLLPTLAAVVPTAARVRADGAGLRLRSRPQRTAEVLGYLAALTPLDVLGRTADNSWLEVRTPYGPTTGWVAAEWLEVFVKLAEVPITTATSEPLPAATAVSAVAATFPAPQPQTSYRFYSNVTAHVREIFQQGAVQGNRPDVFSKVGDSITVSSVFMNPIGLGRYSLHDYAELQPVVDYYSSAAARDGLSSFSNPSLAAKVGWRAAAVLSAGSADPAYCQPDEAPLVCEYRLVRPSIALIMLGTNDVPGTPVDAYEQDMRRVLDVTLEWGIVPVVSTIPPLYRTGLEGRSEQLNAVLTRLALEYDVPLWDYWASLQSLPNTGVGRDGVHPTWAPVGHSADFAPEYLQYGMTVRNLTGLYVLDAVWRAATQP